MIIIYEGHKIEILKKDLPMGSQGIVIKVEDNKIFDSISADNEQQ